MSTIIMVLLLIIAIILTLWLVIIPAGVLAGSFKALRNGGWKGRRRHRPPPP